jgi:hypothetical protein
MDAGSAKRAYKYSKILNCPIALIDKRRTSNDDKAVAANIIGDIEGKTVLLYQLYNYSEGDSGIIPDDIMEKLNKKFEKVNEGIINNYDGMYQEDTYKDDMIDAMG